MKKILLYFLTLTVMLVGSASVLQAQITPRDLAANHDRIVRRNNVRANKNNAIVRHNNHYYRSNKYWYKNRNKTYYRHDNGRHKGWYKHKRHPYKHRHR